MTNNESRWDQPELPFQKHSDTSREAAEAATPSARTLRARVYAAISLSGPRGATDEELQDALKMNPSTERPRRIELVDAGLVVDSLRTRPTHAGRKAVVWVATHHEGGHR